MNHETFRWPVQLTDAEFNRVYDYMTERFPEMTIDIDDEGFVTQSWPVGHESQ